MSQNREAGAQFGNELVQRFSDGRRQSEPGDTMVRGLATRTVLDNRREDQFAALQDQWNMFLLEGRELSLGIASDDDEAFLLDQGRQLHAAWKKFCKKLPDDQQKTLYERLPSIRYLHESVTKASETWKEHQNSKVGRLKKIFTGLCNTLDAHSNLVSIIPTDDKYVRLLTGSLSAITQATVNHRKLADGVADSLEELSEDVGYWNELIGDHPRDAKMHRYLIRIYVVVFEFLTEVFLQWSKSSWNRFITSFDQNAFQKLFEEKRKRIKTIEGYMQRRASLISNRQVDDIIARQTGMGSQMRNMLQDITCHIQTLYRLGNDTHNLLLPYTLPSEDSVRPLTLPYSSDPLSLLQTSQVSPSIKATEEIDAPENLDTVSDLDLKHEGQRAQSDMGDRWQNALEALGPIFAKFDRDIQNLVQISSQATELRVRHPMKRRITAWTTNIESDQLWIEGCHDTSHPSQSTLITASLTALSNNHDIPCISFFCSLQIHNAYEMVPTRRQMLLDMVKSLTAQLLLIGKRTQAKEDISLRSFKHLTDPGLELETALALLRDTRSIMPPLIHCVIEGVQELEDRGDIHQTRDLQEVLQAMMDLKQTPAPLAEGSSDYERGEGVTTELANQASARQIKVCFASDGYVDALARMVEAGQLEKTSHEDGGDEPRDDDDGELLDRNDYEEE
ncbi:hypothetical protein O1611_g154 [Lasiodiplodia mahajangana]|uniref:Uncharacterized protein n=1 Tax=Lasiodiplodia mahajangana TaxID=1108764 RepID=A0ACC2K1K5_9PEZI|nr:hypothetical protein O1611_g154 [Lasiodiplodia mahajangana]